MKLLQALTPKKAVILICIVSSLAYFNILFNGFVWDDEEQIVNNAIIQNLGNINQIFSGATFSTGGAGLSGWFFRPFLTLSYMLNYAIWGANAWGFHLFQLTFHLLNAILIFKILSLLLPKTKISQSVSLVGALIFAVHPAINEAVSYIAASSEVMYTFFNLSALYLIIKNQTFNWKILASIALLLLSGTFLKESSVVIFPILAAFLLIFKKTSRQALFLTLTSTLIIYLFIRLILVHTPFRSPEFAPISDASLITRLLTIPSELMFYLSNTIFPKNLAISQHFLVLQPNFPHFFLQLFILLTLLGLLCFYIYKTHSKLALFGLIWFGVSFGLISNIFPLDMTVAERWYYAPFVGIIFILAALLNSLLNFKPKLIPAILALVLIAIAGLTTRNLIRNTNWVDGLTLYSHDLKISQNSFDLENNLGVELFRAGQFSEAKKHFERSIALQPKWHFAYNNLGAVYEKEGYYAKAQELYQKTLSLSDYYLAHENRTNLELFHGDIQKAKVYAEGSLKKLPNNPKLWFLLALINYKLNDQPSALKAAQNSYLLSPTPQTQYVLNQLSQNKPIDF